MSECTESSESEIRQIRHIYPLRSDYFRLSGSVFAFWFVFGKRTPKSHVIVTAMVFLRESSEEHLLNATYFWFVVPLSRDAVLRSPALLQSILVARYSRSMCRTLGPPSHLLLALNQRPIQPIKAATPDQQSRALHPASRHLTPKNSIIPSLTFSPASYSSFRSVNLRLTPSSAHFPLLATLGNSTAHYDFNKTFISSNCLNLLPFHSISLLSLTPLLRKAKAFYELLHFWTIKISRSVGFEGNTPTAVYHLVHDIFAHH